MYLFGAKVIIDDDAPRGPWRHGRRVIILTLQEAEQAALNNRAVLDQIMRERRAFFDGVTA